MINLSELFWNASIAEIKQGYLYDDKTEEYICLICGKTFGKGVIYPYENLYYEAEKMVKVHAEKEHESMFEFLLNMDKKLTGLTDHQRKLLDYFYKGISDHEIVQLLGGGSTSTIRNHRFTFREKAKQAKILLVMVEMLEGRSQRKNEFIGIHRTATMVDERYAITAQEHEQILEKYFDKGLEGPLKRFPSKEKRKIAVLKHIMSRFELGRQYSEKEVNEILKQVYEDYVTIRRYLIEYGFMDRQKDCSVYWVKV